MLSTGRKSARPVTDIIAIERPFGTCANLVWVFFGGWIISLLYLIAGLFLTCTVCGIPLAVQAFKLARLALWPFGSTVRHPEYVTKMTQWLNIAWLLTFGWPIILLHLILGAILTCTICGIPFGKQHFKMVRVAMSPFGKIVSSPATEEYSRYYHKYHHDVEGGMGERVKEKAREMGSKAKKKGWMSRMHEREEGGVSRAMEYARQYSRKGESRTGIMGWLFS